jgi:gliding motility-associated lipoprotein GldH
MLTDQKEDRKMLKYFVVFLLLVSVVSCGENLLKSEFKSTDNGMWAKDNQIEFAFSEMDTIIKHDVFINVRNDNSYPYNNLFLIANMEFPDGESVTDTLEYEMALPDGTWLGKGYGSIKENKLWYKENIVFPSSGVYTIRLSHAMRKNGDVNGVVNLEGITDLGFEITKSNK